MSFSLINQRKLTPVNVLLAACAAWGIFYVVAPIEVYRAQSDYPYLILGACLIGLLLGLVVFEPRRADRAMPPPEDLRRTLRQIYEIAFMLGTIGIALRIADWVFLRGLSIDTEFMENREKIETAGSNAFAMASTVLVPFSLIPYMMHAVAKRNGTQVGRAWQAIGLAALWPLLTIVIGSRSSMFMSLGMLIISRLIIFPRTSRKIVAFCALLVVGLIYAGGLIFIERLTQIGLDVESVIRLSAFTHLAPVTQTYFSITSKLSDWGRDTVFIATTFVQYYVHGVPEFAYLVEHYAKGDEAGAYTFSIFPRLAAALWGVPYDGNASMFLMPRVGIYTTIFGPFYIDFGPFTPLFCFAFGALVSWTRRQVLRGNIAALPLYICFLMQIAAAVVMNAIQSAYGIFFNLAFIGFWIAMAALRSRPAKRPPLLAQARP
ncbi:oligosaccharide repeat unit polymerase [Inquilinus limosus]|uniref:oligosaccharide repeat unit polymerase n=1 Tax=Inquilinus limosus TaxID=171674 RepID=UPI0004196D4C|nr:oligosaccharide repeat unit polymerase [Inquilinus limosus]